MQYFATYAGRNGVMDKEKGLFNVGPIVTVNTDGILTEADSSLEKQGTTYNYGNIFDGELKEIILKRAKVLEPDDWYNACYEESEKYYTYML